MSLRNTWFCIFGFCCVNSLGLYFSCGFGVYIGRHEIWTRIVHFLVYLHAHGYIKLLQFSSANLYPSVNQKQDGRFQISYSSSYSLWQRQSLMFSCFRDSQNFTSLIYIYIYIHTHTHMPTPQPKLWRFQGFFLWSSFEISLMGKLHPSSSLSGCAMLLETNESVGVTKLGRGWIVRSHLGWGGERNILYEGVKTSPLVDAF